MQHAQSNNALRKSRQAGFGLIEIVIAAAVIVGVLIGVTSYFFIALKVSSKTTDAIQANYLLVEGIDAMKLLRDDSWNSNIASLATSTEHFLNYSFLDNKWETASTSVLINGNFTRLVQLDDVYRDGLDDIADSGTYDPDTKFVTVTVSWFYAGTSTARTMSTYITNLFQN